MKAATGGFVIHKAPLVRAGLSSHTAALERPVSQVDLDALNAIQRTPWRINQWLLDVVAEAWDRELPVGGLPVHRAGERPKRLPDDVWEAMGEDERKAHRRALSDVHGRLASLEGRRHATLDKLVVAQEMRDRTSIWFPHSRDFRGRIYPIITSGPHPQSDDLGKALLMFSSGLPLGPDGLFWLCVRAANCAGKDKLSLEQRVAWAMDNAEMIRAVAVDPLAMADAWTGLDEPWGFVATCHELAQAFDDPEGFVSHLPIPLDGSCNGLQHLSAMGLDPVGARATNLQPGPRQDIYEDVAAVVRAKVERDAAAGVPEAFAWHGKVTRRVCKRAVMTTPYGVTDRGIRRQLVADGHVPDAANTERGAAADYLADCLVEALGQTVSAARSIMAWLQSTSDSLAKAGQPFMWTTPTGSQVRQAYFRPALKRVRTLVGRLVLAEEVDGGILHPRKQALGSAPNYVHSFDAAALALTVNACQRDGVRSFAMIHDSFATHAANTTTMSRLIRDEFVEMYRTDWLRETHSEVQAYAATDIPPPPARGDFNIELVRDAEFFFS